jgi:RNA polymerase sigma-70 factor (ECF subfamily)
VGVVKSPIAEPERLIPDSFTEFYRREWRDVVGLGFVLTGNRWIAEDLAQEGFAAACRDWDRVSDLDKPGAWVRKVVVNRSASWFRRRGAERRALARVGSPAAERDLDVDGEVAEVWEAVRTLPKRQAQAIALVYFDGMTVAETSQGQWMHDVVYTGERFVAVGTDLNRAFGPSGKKGTYFTIEVTPPPPQP